MFDPTGSGAITAEQYKEALNCFGIDKPVVDIVSPFDVFSSSVLFLSNLLFDFSF
jgi:uncharacterized protein YpuA (DUF1002 family)